MMVFGGVDSQKQKLEEIGCTVVLKFIFIKKLEFTILVNSKERKKE
jgi:hypothetical protein